MTTYEPGTLAVATVRGVPNVRVMRVRSNLSASEWASAQGRGPRMHEGHEVTDVRPLVTLDPEDHEQVERLVRTWLAADGDVPTRHGIDAMRAALRSLLAPPKPEEPTGLGAVVEDSKGVRWARSGDGAWHDDDGGSVTEFGRIDAVRKLSDGWVQE